MEDNEKLKSDLLPYLKLKESEEILVINKYRDGYILPIKDLPKYIDPNQLPKKFFPIQKNNYEYNEIAIFTNYRVIFFCLSLEHLKDDGVTPILDIFHIDNYLVWINNEDIKEFDIVFGGLWKGITVALNFYHDEGDTVKLLPMHIPCSNYTNYLKVKDALIHPLELNSVKMKFLEQQQVKSIRSFNESFKSYGTLALGLLGLFLLSKIIDEEISFAMNYVGFGLYVLYVIFFVSYNFYWTRTLKKNYETFLSFAEKGFTWYQGPWVSILVFLMCGIAIFIDFAYQLFISNNFLSLLASIGSLACVFVLVMSIATIIDNKKKKKSKLS